MKELTIVIVCIILVITGSNISLNYIKKNTNKFIEELEELKIKIKEDKTNTENIELATKICEKWEEVEDNLSIIIVHNELEQIKLSLVGMKTYIQEEKYEESMEQLEKAIYMLKYLEHQEKLDLSHVF